MCPFRVKDYIIILTFSNKKVCLTKCFGISYSYRINFSLPFATDTVDTLLEIKTFILFHVVPFCVHEQSEHIIIK